MGNRLFMPIKRSLVQRSTHRERFLKFEAFATPYTGWFQSQGFKWRGNMHMQGQQEAKSNATKVPFNHFMPSSSMKQWVNLQLHPQHAFHKKAARVISISHTMDTEASRSTLESQKRNTVHRIPQSSNLLLLSNWVPKSYWSLALGASHTQYVLNLF